MSQLEQDHDDHHRDHSGLWHFVNGDDAGDHDACRRYDAGRYNAGRHDDPDDDDDNHNDHAAVHNRLDDFEHDVLSRAGR